MNSKNPPFSACSCRGVNRLRTSASPFACFAIAFCALLTASPAVAQDKPDDILLVSVGESADRYSDVATHLQGLLSGATGYTAAQVDIFEDSTIESLADGYYDQNTEDKNLRAKVVEGYGAVILIPTIIQTPTKTIEYGEYGGGPTNVYDDAPFDNEYFAPEVFYEGCTQFSKLILGAQSTPMIFLPGNPDEQVSDYGPIMYRVASGVAMDLIPGAYALDTYGATTSTNEAYLYAACIFTQLTGLNASESSYSPVLPSSGDATTLGNTAETTVNLHETTVHYTTSYENDGAVVYRSLDVTQAPFNDVVRYMYKGSSTHDWTSDALTLIINSNPATTKANRKLGTLNGVNSNGVRYWHPDDIADQGYKFALEPDEAAFMYVSGSWSGEDADTGATADAQTVIDMTQANMVPFAFDWIKAFYLTSSSGTEATEAALDYHDCNELYFNYAERGWKLIPLTIGMGRINEATTDFAASDDALHCSDLLVYMNAYMMLSSSLGQPFPLLTAITEDDIHRGSHTLDDINEACLIGHDIITELAFLSETGAYVPESDLEITTDSLQGELMGVPYTNQLAATGGDGTYSWEVISSLDLPSGLSLSSDGVLSGSAYEAGTFGVGFKVTDGTGAFRKVGLKLTIDPNSDLSIANDDSMILLENTTKDILLTGTDSEGSTNNLFYAVADGPTNGMLTGTAPALTYSPNTDFVGEDSFTFTVSDGVNSSVPATVSISVGSAQTNLEFADLSAALSENTLVVGGSANNLIVSGAASDSDYLYSVSYTGADYDFDGLNDTLTFDVRVKAWTGGTTELGIDDAGSTTSASATIGLSSAAVNISDGARFTAGGDTQMQDGESLEFVLENPVVSLTDAGKVGSAVSAGFNAARLVETHNGNSHQTIFGAGTELLGWDWDGPFDVSDISVGAGSLYISSGLTTSTTTRPFHWGVGDVGFGINVSVTDNYATWASGYGLVDDDAFADADTENGGAGDGYANLLEFALGMDPTVSDAGSKESIYTEVVGASTYFAYAYERRTDYLAQGLTYTLVVSPDLVTPSAESPFDVSIGDAVDGFRTITTRYLIEDDAKFIQLQVDMD
ncbi:MULTISPECIES: Ig-like domain-containing protein [unclassified Lentimonas]|uniref:Ig-like domain-containing protein n=1 Tax=unclassified Lentimonas TaxID=2630993 RepID=UPI00132B37E7|nr:MULTISPECIES: Ig-like domain-containing protein [unclassified Lentimonas]CAA6691587.1 Unannotated [Lentimonas sp. CC19]CAA6692225.1 Unannotated [Lentimonas sp. CC10]CAA7070167.1 Unannotated [Lentimonas sp. CC11]